MNNDKLYTWGVTLPDGREEKVYYPLMDVNGILYNAPRISEELIEHKHYPKDISVGLQSDFSEYIELSEELPMLKDYEAIFVQELADYRAEQDKKNQS